MKKINFILAAFAAVFALSCNKEITNVQTPDASVPAGMKMVTLTATAEGATKTTYTDNGEGVGVFSWTKGDQISVWCSDEKFHTLTAESNGASVSFSGMIPEEVSLGWYAFYPAEEDHQDCKFSIPSYKDISATNSAELPMIGENNAGVFAFKHCSGAAKITLTNVPDFCKTVEVSIKTLKLKVSGIFSVSKYSEDPTVWLWSQSYGGSYASPVGPDSELVFTRKVQVIDNTAIVYLPWEWGSSDGLRHDSTVDVIGYDNNDNSYVLLENKTMKKLGDFSRAVVKVLSPLELPDYVPPVDWDKVDWEGENVAIVTNTQESADAKCEELRVVADEYYMYSQLICALETPFKADYIDILLSDGDANGDGSAVVWDQWPGTVGVNNYYKEHKGTIDSNGNLTSMTFNYNDVYENIEYKTEISNDKIYWYFAFPVDFLSTYKSEDNKIYVGFRLWSDWANYAAIPARGWGQSMLEVTLP